MSNLSDDDWETVEHLVHLGYSFNEVGRMRGVDRRTISRGLVQHYRVAGPEESVLDPMVRLLRSQRQVLKKTCVEINKMIKVFHVVRLCLVALDKSVFTPEQAELLETAEAQLDTVASVKYKEEFSSSSSLTPPDSGPPPDHEQKVGRNH
jgi:hypothetical protein